MSMVKKRAILGLYRNILRHAKIFPSVKRDAIYEEIRLKFREDRGITDTEKAAASVQLATDSLNHLKQYTDLRNNSGAWKIELSKNPMPKPASDTTEPGTDNTGPDVTQGKGKPDEHSSTKFPGA